MNSFPPTTAWHSLSHRVKFTFGFSSAESSPLRKLKATSRSAADGSRPKQSRNNRDTRRAPAAATTATTTTATGLGTECMSVWGAKQETCTHTCDNGKAIHADG